MVGKEHAAFYRMAGEEGMRLFMEGAVTVGRHLFGAVLRQPSAGLRMREKTAKPHLSRTGRYGFVLYSGGKVLFPHVRCLALLTNGLKSFSFASLIDNLSLTITIFKSELDCTTDRNIFG